MTIALPPTPPIYEPKYGVTEQVLVDGEISGFVVEISISVGPVYKYRVEWFHNGHLQSGWFDQFRLEF